MNCLLPASLYLFIVSAFALPTEAAFSLVFYVCAMPLAVLSATWTAKPAGVWLALALILWSGLTLLWGEDDGGRSLRFLLGVAASAAFVLALSDVLAERAERRRLATVLVCAGAANAAFVLVLNEPGLMRGERILGWGVTRHPILGGSVMAVACITALSRSVDFGGKAATKLFYGAASGIMACFVIAMQSRGALLGLAGGGILIAARRVRMRSLAAMAAGVVLLGFALAAGRMRELLTMVVARGTSHRLDIWAHTLPLIEARPLFGHGLAANLPVSPTGFPHSLYLSLLFYSGAVGLSLFGALAALVTLRLLRTAAPERDWVAGLWVNALLAGLTDFGQITKGPGPLWFILWLPMLLALALPVSPRAAAADLPSAAS
jgi:O-antigen ligase